MNATRSANRTGPRIRIGGIEGGAKLSGVQLSKGDLLKLAGASAAVTTILTGCGPNGAVSTTEAAPPTDKVPTTAPPTAIPTVEGPVNLDVTPTPNIEQSIPSPFEQAGLAYGSYGVDSAGKPVITGGITSSDFEQSNPGTKYTIFGDENGTNVVNTLYPTSNPEVTAATMLDQTTLDKLFKAETGKNGITTGVLPDGTEVVKNGPSWIDGDGNVFITIVPSKAGNPFGYPLLVQDQNGKLFVGITDASGALVEGEQFNPAFQSPAVIAQDAGFDKHSEVKKATLTSSGTLQFFGENNVWIGELKFVGDGKTVLEEANEARYNDENRKNEVISEYKNALGVEGEALMSPVPIIDKTTGATHILQISDDGVPLFKLENGQWHELTQRDLFSYLGIVNGIGISGEGDFAFDPNRPEVTEEQKRHFFEQFEVFAVTPQIYLGDFPGLIDDSEYLRYIGQIAGDNNMTTYAPHLVGHAYAIDSPEWTRQFKAEIAGVDTPEEKQSIAKAWMTERMETILTEMPNVSQINVVNEVLRYDGTSVTYNQWPMLDAFDGDPALMIVTALETAQEVSREHGKNPTLLINEWGVEQPGPKSDAFVRLLDDVQTQLEQSGKNIPFGIGLQFHITELKSQFYGFSSSELTEEALIKQFELFGQYGPVYITELKYEKGSGSMAQTEIVTDNAKLNELFAKILNAAIASKSVEGIIFWDPILGDTFLDSNWNKNVTFFNLQKQLLSGLY